MRPAEKRLAEFKAGSGRYVAKPKRPYAQPEARTLFGCATFVCPDCQRRRA